jgi:hypothetical protein
MSRHVLAVPSARPVFDIWTADADVQSHQL